MTCHEARLHLLDRQRGTLPLDAEHAVAEHLASCSDCTRADAAERELTRVLEERLPQHPAPLALKRRLAAHYASQGATRGEVRRRGRWIAPVAAAAMIVLAVSIGYTTYDSSRRAAVIGAVTADVVNDHLRVLRGDRPLGVKSGGIHQVKPWFAGRLDFAPVVAFEGDANFPLRGGAVEYVGGRPAAVFVYGRRLHTITLIVFRADDLAWPTRGLEPLGPVQAWRTVDRGFNVILWRSGGLGYALTSDVDAKELATLPPRITPRPAGVTPTSPPVAPG
jgi:anti-sigma factor RsiW